jgi:hypothetical protein
VSVVGVAELQRANRSRKAAIHGIINVRDSCDCAGIEKFYVIA